ncbi:MAG TPA: sugar phosphate isomerase/epimerase [Clostridiaceae bacterium]|nr:sugar phosphate isomerase/epimerase [Clostridiaceae bacterium]
MTRPITLASGQFGDIDLADLCKLVSEIGYDGLELATHAHFNVSKAIDEPGYIDNIKNLLSENGLKCYAISAHLTGQCVGDDWDPRLDNFAPKEIAGKPTEITNWAIKEMKRTAEAAAKMGVKVVTGFTGSPIWKYWYSYPQTTTKMIDDGFKKIYDLWTPIFDVFDEYDVKFALEVHPAEIAFDYYSTKTLFEVFDNRQTLGLNYDPSHLVWQGVNELSFLRDFFDRIYHVHIKDVKVNKNDKAGILGSHLEFGDPRRKWNFVSVGHGDVDFDGIVRELNYFQYEGPLSVEWEDSGMDRIYGATESYEYINKLNYKPSSIAFDSALTTK